MAQKKNIDFSNIQDLFQQEIIVPDKETGEEKKFKTVNRAEVCAITVIQPNYRADRYSELLCKLIEENIDACAGLYPESVKFEYIRDLFVVPKYTKPEVLRREYSKFKGSRSLYPFQNYMHWEPEEKGYILQSDSKFLSIIYTQHGDIFLDKYRYRDAAEETKQDIYKFIDNSGNAVMVVDCENSDPYKLFGVLKNLNAAEVDRLKKIVLYDDSHTTMAWFSTSMTNADPRSRTPWHPRASSTVPSMISTAGMQPTSRTSC